MSNWLSPYEKKKRINKIRELSSSETRVYLTKKAWSYCPDCEWDSVKEESKNSACAICGGIGRISVDTIISLLAKVRKLDPTEQALMKTGYLPRGEMTFTVDIIYEDTVDDAEEATIDEQEVKITGKRYRGHPEPNRITYYVESI